LCCPAPLPACGNHSGEAERSYGIGLKLFGFIPEPVLMEEGLRVVLHEILTGKRLFEGDDLTETLASVVKDRPDLSRVPVRFGGSSSGGVCEAP